MLTTAPGIWGASPYYYAMGWLRRPEQDNWWHDGSLPGTTTLLVRAGNGLEWAALFNARNMKPNSLFAAELDPALWQAVGRSDLLAGGEPVPLAIWRSSNLAIETARRLDRQDIR
jgi:hypothetical protein